MFIKPTEIQKTFVYTRVSLDKFQYFRYERYESKRSKKSKNIVGEVGDQSR